MTTLLILAGLLLVGFLLENLFSRVRKLEEMYGSAKVLQAAKPQQVVKKEVKQVVQTQASNPVVTSAPARAPLPAPAALPHQPDAGDRLIAWVKEDWLLKLGALLLLIGFGWLTTYAFLNNWIGPVGRITLGIFAGIIFLVFGWYRIKTFIHQGGVFLVLGSTTILLTVYAAREYYNFFTPLSALVVMFLSTAFVAYVSVKEKSEALTLSSLILAGVAPLLTGSPQPNYEGLFAYLLVVLLGTVWVVAVTGKRELTLAGLILIFFYSIPHLFSYVDADKSILLVFVYAFVALFFVTNLAGLLKLHTSKEVVPDLVTAAGSGMLLLAWILVAANKDWQSLIISAWMVVFGVGAFVLFKITGRREPFYIHAGVGIAMLAAATSAELQGATLTIAYIVESGVIALIINAIFHDIKITERAALLLIGPVLFSFQSMASSAWATSVYNKDFFVLLTMSVVLHGLGLYFLKASKNCADSEPRTINTVLIVTGSVYALVLVWLAQGAPLTIAYIAETAALVFVIHALLRDIKITEKTALLFVGPALLALKSVFSAAWSTSVFNSDFMVLLTLSATLFGVGLFFRDAAKNSDEDTRKINYSLINIGSAYVYALLWQALGAAFKGYTAVMIALVTYTIVGLITYVYGTRENKKGFKLYGGIVLGLVVVRLLSVDVWGMEMVGKISTFFMIGALLLSTAFMGKKSTSN